MTDLEKQKREKIEEKAREGSLTAIQILNKIEETERFDSARKRIFQEENQNQNNLLPVNKETVGDISYGDIQEFINKGENKLIPESLSIYLERLELARSLFVKYRSKAFVVSTLVKTIKDKDGKYISSYIANNIFYDAINFFYLDNGIKKDAWRNIYAEQLEKAAELAIEVGDIETYRRCVVSAGDMRGLQKDDPPEVDKKLLDRRPIVYTLNPKEVGLEPVNRNELAKFIDSIPDVTEEEKERFKRDAQVLKPQLFEEDEEDQE